MLVLENYVNRIEYEKCLFDFSFVKFVFGERCLAKRKAQQKKCVWLACQNNGDDEVCMKFVFTMDCYSARIRVVQILRCGLQGVSERLSPGDSVARAAWQSPSRQPLTAVSCCFSASAPMVSCFCVARHSQREPQLASFWGNENIFATRALLLRIDFCANKYRRKQIFAARHSSRKPRCTSEGGCVWHTD